MVELKSDLETESLYNSLLDDLGGFGDLLFGSAATAPLKAQVARELAEGQPMDRVCQSAVIYLAYVILAARVASDKSQAFNLCFQTLFSFFEER